VEIHGAAQRMLAMIPVLLQSCCSQHHHPHIPECIPVLMVMRKLQVSGLVIHIQLTLCPVIRIVTKIEFIGPWAMPYPSEKFRQNPFTTFSVI